MSVSLLTTKVWSGFQIAATRRPGPSCSSPAPAFWAKTWMSAPPSVCTTYCVETPRKLASVTWPSSTFDPLTDGRPGVGGLERDLLGPHADPHRPLARRVHARAGTVRRAAPSASKVATSPSRPVGRASIRFDEPRKLATNSVRGVS